MGTFSGLLSGDAVHVEIGEPMTVYRVECTRTGTGPCQMNNKRVPGEAGDVLWRRYLLARIAESQMQSSSFFRRQPHPNEDFNTARQWRGQLFGFERLDQVVAWFGCPAIRAFYALDYAIYKYRVPRFVRSRSGKQIVFPKSPRLSAVPMEDVCAPGRRFRTPFEPLRRPEPKE